MLSLLGSTENQKKSIFIYYEKGNFNFENTEHWDLKYGVVNQPLGILLPSDHVEGYSLPSLNASGKLKVLCKRLIIIYEILYAPAYLILHVINNQSKIIGKSIVDDEIPVGKHVYEVLSNNIDIEGFNAYNQGADNPQKGAIRILSVVGYME